VTFVLVVYIHNVVTTQPTLLSRLIVDSIASSKYCLVQHQLIVVTRSAVQRARINSLILSLFGIFVLMSTLVSGFRMHTTMQSSIVFRHKHGRQSFFIRDKCTK
jgi:uncharacterized membrane protein YcfT